MVCMEVCPPPPHPVTQRPRALDAREPRMPQVGVYFRYFTCLKIPGIFNASLTRHSWATTCTHRLPSAMGAGNSWVPPHTPVVWPMCPAMWAGKACNCGLYQAYLAQNMPCIYLAYPNFPALLCFIDGSGKDAGLESRIGYPVPGPPPMWGACDVCTGRW